MTIAIDATYLKSDGAMIIYSGLIDSVCSKYSTNREVILYYSSKAIPPITARPTNQIPITFHSKIHFFLWHIFIFHSILKRQKCEHLYAIGGYYLGGFKPFSIVIQSLLPFEKGIVKQYSFALKIKYGLLRRFYIHSIKKAEEIFIFTRHSQKYLSESNYKPTGEIEFLEFKVKIKKQAAESDIHTEKENPLIFLYPAHLTYYKNHLRLGRVFTRLQQAGFKVKLFLIGRKDGSESDSILKALSQLPNSESFIVYDGFIARTEIGEYYGRADYLIYPSLVESIGVPLYEGILLDKPILCSNHITIATQVAREETADGNVIGKFCVKKEETAQGGGYNKIKFFDPENEGDMFTVIQEAIATGMNDARI
ncbi:MAG: glycosyltransferase [Ignavibacteriaceae bacterium]|jgi:glycosyltransferase involved in cell wall biosynthesis|nr:glycosyltransferase [Ignavibacteriaceae bacterium]